MILPTTGCPPRLLSIVKFFHEDMKTAFSMTPSRILGFQATQLVRTGLPSTRANFIHPQFTVRWRIATYF